MSSPRVSVVVPAFNLADYLPAALDSALTQNPVGPIELIVIDDGSTDHTPAVLAGYGEQIRVIRQPNAGLRAAIERGLVQAQGEFIALLDADDVWPRDRLARHLALLDGHPEVGLTYGDMEVIDVDGAIVEPSFFAGRSITPGPARMLGRLMSENFIGTSAVTLRASMLPAVLPIHTVVPYPDWWLAVCVSAVAELGLVDGISYGYRVRRDNMLLGAGPERQPEAKRRLLPWLRWMLTEVADDPTVSAPHIQQAIATFWGSLRIAAGDSLELARGLIEVDRAAAAAARDSAKSHPGSLPYKALANAWALDPFDQPLTVELELALRRGAATALPPAPPPITAVPLRSTATLAWVDELVERPALLSAFVEETHQGADESLVILSGPGSDLARLVAIFANDPSLQDEQVHATVVAEPATAPARAWLGRRATARLSAADDASPYAALPAHAAIERAGAVA